MTEAKDGRPRRRMRCSYRAASSSTVTCWGSPDITNTSLSRARTKSNVASGLDRSYGGGSNVASWGVFLPGGIQGNVVGWSAWDPCSTPSMTSSPGCACEPAGASVEIIYRNAWWMLTSLERWRTPTTGGARVASRLICDAFTLFLRSWAAEVARWTLSRWFFDLVMGCDLIGAACLRRYDLLA